MNRTQRLLGYAAALASGTLGGLMYGINKELTAHMGALPVTFGEALIALAILLPLYGIRFRRNLIPQRTPWGWLIVFGLTAVTLFYFRVLGVVLTSATTAALLTRFELVLVFTYSYVFLAERPSLAAWLGALALIGGMVCALDLPSASLTLRLGGVAAGLACAVGLASNAIVIKLHLGRVSNQLTAVCNVGIQAVVFPFLLLATGQTHGLAPALAQPRLLLLLVLGGACIPGMLVTYYFSMKRVPLWSCRLLDLINPVVALFADHFWLRSAISLGQLLGLALVVGGATLVITSGLSRPVAVPQVEAISHPREAVSNDH